MNQKKKAHVAVVQAMNLMIKIKQEKKCKIVENPGEY